MGPNPILPVTWLLEAHDEATDRPPAGHRRRPHSPHARLGANARLRRVALHPPTHRRRAGDRERGALSGDAPPRAKEVDPGRVGALGEQSPGEVLLAHRGRPKAAASGSRDVAHVCGSGVQAVSYTHLTLPTSDL